MQNFCWRDAVQSTPGDRAREKSEALKNHVKGKCRKQIDKTAIQNTTIEIMFYLYAFNLACDVRLTDKLPSLAARVRRVWFPGSTAGADCGDDETIIIQLTVAGTTVSIR